MDTTIRLGRTGVHVTRLGIGAMTWGRAQGLSRLHPAKLAYGGPESADDEREAFEAARAGGVGFFDTAAMYSGGASEIRLGELTRGTDAVVATKFPPGLRDTAEDLPQALRGSLARLGRSQVDLYMHHFPTRRVDIPRLMHLMADAVEAGQVRAVGVSNYSAEQLRQAHAALAARGIPLASNQVEYSLLHRQPETNGVLETCRELGVTLICYQPLAGGALTGKYLQARPRGLRRFMMGYFRPDADRPLGPVIDPPEGDRRPPRPHPRPGGAALAHPGRGPTHPRRQERRSSRRERGSAHVHPGRGRGRTTHRSHHPVEMSSRATPAVDPDVIAGYPVTPGQPEAQLPTRGATGSL